MDPDARSRVSDLYHRALAQPDAARAAFLVEVCAGDEALRQEVESLLRYEARSSGFLERPAAVGIVPTVDMTMLNRQIGTYTIVAPLGVGGMGEVYRARDSKLGRDVAIKILPSQFTSDPERRSRFAREARLLATLNHPNIGAIYGLEESDGVAALVLELVEGPTLADRLKKGPLPIAEALDHRAPDRRGARRSPPERHRPSRPEAGQHRRCKQARHRATRVPRCSTSAWRRSQPRRHPARAPRRLPRPPRTVGFSARLPT